MKKISNSLAAAIHKNERNAGGYSEKIVHPWWRQRKLFKRHYITYLVF